MIFWIPPAAAIAFTIVYLYSAETQAISKAAVVGVVVIALILQFASGILGGWVLGLLLNVGIAIYISLCLELNR